MNLPKKLSIDWLLPGVSFRHGDAAGGCGSVPEGVRRPLRNTMRGFI